MNEKQSQLVLHMLKLHHARLRATRPELLPDWKAIYINRFSKPDPLHFKAYAPLLDKTCKNESVDYIAVL
jgi:hypothetical protein